MNCPNCGAAILYRDTYCRYCGSRMVELEPREPVREQTPPVQQAPQVTYVVAPPMLQTPVSCKSRIFALILCLLFGVFGLHRFYLGKVGTGLLYLMTGGFFGIGWVLDALVLILGSPKDGAGLPVKW